MLSNRQIAYKMAAAKFQKYIVV